MPRPPRTWKAVELAVARLLNGRRCHFEGQDVECAGWSVEVKHGRQIPRTLVGWWEQAQQNARDGKRPMLVLHPLGADYGDSLAVVKLEDLVELLPKDKDRCPQSDDCERNGNQIRATSAPTDDSVRKAEYAPSLPESTSLAPHNERTAGPPLAQKSGGRQP